MGRHTKRPALRYGSAAVGAILLFDTLAAVISRSAGWAYSQSNIGSLAIYLAVGFFSGRRFSIKVAVAMTMLTGAAESTVGWAIAWALGPGRQPAVLARPGLIVAVIVTVLLVAGLIGFVGGLLGVWVREGATYDDPPE